jgi:hypothetical protein
MLTAEDVSIPEAWLKPACGSGNHTLDEGTGQRLVRFPTLFQAFQGALANRQRK